ncbi:MAG: hypothetical protein AAB316_02655, partial [Bacteroidota bacterium]
QPQRGGDFEEFVAKSPPLWGWKVGLRHCYKQCRPSGAIQTPDFQIAILWVINRVLNPAFPQPKCGVQNPAARSSRSQPR